MTTLSPEITMQFLYALRAQGVTDKRVLQAMERINRSTFVHYQNERAFDDVPLPINCGQTISQPSVVGLMTQALKVQPRDKVLEVGTGSDIRQRSSHSSPAASIRSNAFRDW